jgi:hypothetical protein
MASARNTKTAFDDAQGNNRTATHLSTNIIIKVGGGNIVGAVQSLQVNETRTIAPIAEVGTDGLIDSAPQSSTTIAGSCNRTRFDKQRILEAFDRGYVHVHAQRIPFDIEIHDIFADSDENNAIITTIKNVWVNSVSYTYSAESFIIAETMGWQAESIYSIIASTNGNVVSAAGNGNGGPVFVNPFEREADRGKYRGALDAAGLLNAFIDG